MIRKLYTILLIGLCLNLVACGDDNENKARLIRWYIIYES